MYEPRIGDLVSLGLGRLAGVVGHEEPDIVVALERCTGMTWRIVDPVPPLRPDAPGQRVRHEGSPALVGRVARDAVDGVVEVAWEAGYGRSFHEPGRLIRIADQTPAAPAAKTCAPPEAPPTEDARKESDYQTAPAAINQGPTCQHCGSGIVAGLLRDTCPRGCDLTLRAAEPEPEIVGTLPWTYANMDAGATMPSLASVHEPVWTAAGRGVAASHPTREGAIAAWREAVQAR